MIVKFWGDFTQTEDLFGLLCMNWTLGGAVDSSQIEFRDAHDTTWTGGFKLQKAWS